MATSQWIIDMAEEALARLDRGEAGAQAVREAALERERKRLLEPKQPPKKPTHRAPASNEALFEQARKSAIELIESYRKRDLYPNLETIADQVANEFRKSGLTGAMGKPVTGAYLKRHALKGISSATVKQLSTAKRRGK
jgi:hypothetical protein